MVLSPQPEPRQLTLLGVSKRSCTHGEVSGLHCHRLRQLLPPCHHPRRGDGYDDPMPCETRGVAVSVSADEACRTLPALIDLVATSHHAVEIVSSNDRAVHMPTDEYANWQETAHLFRSPKNARRLLDAYEQILTDSRTRPDRIAGALEGVGVQIGDKGAPVSSAQTKKRWNHTGSSHPFCSVPGLCHRFGHYRTSRW